MALKKTLNQRSLPEESLVSSLLKTSIIDACAMIFLIMQMTNLLSPIGFYLKFDGIRSISIISVAVLVFYIAINIRTLAILLQYRVYFLLFVAIALLPPFFLFIQYCIEMYDAERFSYWIGFEAYASSLFISSTILIYKNRNVHIALFAFISYVLILFAFSVNKISPQTINDSLYFSSSVILDASQIDRLMGFYNHPNEAGIATVMIFVLFTKIFRDYRLILFSFLALGVLTFLTGSRTSLAMLVFWYLSSIFIRAGNIKGVLRILGISAVLLSTAAVILPYIAPILQQQISSQALDRFNALSAGGINEVLDADDSAAIRARVFFQYIDLVEENSLSGIGFDHIYDLRGAGIVEEVSQISWLEWAAQFGIFYPISLFILFLFVIFQVFNLKFIDLESYREKKLFVFFILLLLLYSFSLVDILNIKCVAITFGLISGSLLRGRVVSQRFYA